MATLLEAEGTDWKLEIVGHLPDLPPFLKVTPRSTIEFDGISKIQCLDVSLGSPREFASGEELSPIFFEAVGYDIHLERRSPSVSLELPAGADVRRSKATTEHHFLNFGNNVGFAEIRVEGTPDPAVIRFEVFSRKVDYKTDYSTMRAEVSSIIRNLAMGANAKTFSTAGHASGEAATLLEWFALVRWHFNELVKVSGAIVKNPHSSLVQDGISVPVSRARRVAHRTIQLSMRRSNTGPIHPGLGVPLPRNIKEARSKLNIDTKENRYFKALLRETHKKILRLINTDTSGDEDSCASADDRFFSSIRSELSDMLVYTDRLLRTPTLRGISDTPISRPNSLLFLTHPLYSRFERICTLVNGGLSLSRGVLPIGLKDTAELYEYWCFLKIVSILCETFHLEQQSIVKFKRTRAVVVLQKGASSAIRFRDKRSGSTLHLVYNRLFNRLPTLAQKPDNIIQFSSLDRFYIFDAKYRVQFDRNYLLKYGGPGPMEEDINTMHRYRDAIAIPHPITKEYQNGVVVGAAVLFPHSQEALYEGHRFHKSLDQVEIGGIPLLPSSSMLLRRKLAQILKDELGITPTTP